MNTLTREKKRFLLALFFFAVLYLLYLHYPSLMAPSPAFRVTQKSVITKDVPITLWGLGNVSSLNKIAVGTQVNGKLIQVLFTEGSEVKAGEVIAVIDPRPYQAQLMQYEGQLARDSAYLANAKLDLSRYQTLWQQNAIAKQTLDTQNALVKQYEGAVAYDQGQVDNAKINLDFCYIKAPVSGKIGLRQIDPGNYIQVGGEKPITVITTRNPTTVLFTLPEDEVTALSSEMRSKKILWAGVYDRTRVQRLAQAAVYAMDSEIDSDTGTIRLRAVVDNANERLYPNQFVNVEVRLRTLKGACVIETASIQYAEEGPYVFVIDEKTHRVSMRPIQILVMLGNESAVSGVQVGEHLVVDGADKLSEGVRVVWE